MAATLINKGEGSKIPPVNDLPSPLALLSAMTCVHVTPVAEFSGTARVRSPVHF